MGLKQHIETMLARFERQRAVFLDKLQEVPVAALSSNFPRYCAEWRVATDMQDYLAYYNDKTTPERITMFVSARVRDTAMRCAEQTSNASERLMRAEIAAAWARFLDSLPMILLNEKRETT